jgi:hypothetical protein
VSIYWGLTEPTYRPKRALHPHQPQVQLAFPAQVASMQRGEGEAQCVGKFVEELAGLWPGPC